MEINLQAGNYNFNEHLVLDNGNVKIAVVFEASREEAVDFFLNQGNYEHEVILDFAEGVPLPKLTKCLNTTPIDLTKFIKESPTL
jgi:hypothetical protein